MLLGSHDVDSESSYMTMGKTASLKIYGQTLKTVLVTLPASETDILQSTAWVTVRLEIRVGMETWVRGHSQMTSSASA